MTIIRLIALIASGPDRHKIIPTITISLISYQTPEGNKTTKSAHEPKQPIKHAVTNGKKRKATIWHKERELVMCISVIRLFLSLFSDNFLDQWIMHDLPGWFLAGE